MKFTHKEFKNKLRNEDLILAQEEETMMKKKEE
jgi:hypothetical protein